MRKKIALVTGGSRGLGKDMALSLAGKGIDVILTYHSKKEEAEKVVRDIEAVGQKAAALRFDAGDIRSLDGFLEEVVNLLKEGGGTWRNLISSLIMQVLVQPSPYRM
jgi:NAD(P)-dependent dehydrogenase (short-subunit alcohol dehydrogenase family)